MEELLTKRNQSWWLPRRPITTEVRCNRQTHRITMMPSGRIRLENHKKAMMAVMLAIEGKKTCPCQTARNKWVRGLLTRLAPEVGFYGRFIQEKKRLRAAKRKADGAAKPPEASAKLKAATKKWLLGDLHLSPQVMQVLDNGVDWVSARAFVQRYERPFRRDARLVGPARGWPRQVYVLWNHNGSWENNHAYAAPTDGTIVFQRQMHYTGPMIKEEFKCRKSQ